jgi:adenylate cyclase
VSSEQIERRLMAVLLADVAGYSRLIGADDEGTFAQLNAYHSELVEPKIKEHRGRIARTTGDGLLALFASVVDALRCAVEIQRAMAERNQAVPPEKRLEFRMGINVGDFIEAASIHGDGVNVAARLEALAEVGGICVSDRVQEDVGPVPEANKFGDDRADVEKARLRLANGLLSIADEDSRDVEVLKRAALQRMALDYKRRR